MQRLLLLSVAALSLPSAVSAQVTDWLVAKGPNHEQTAADTAPAVVSDWRAILNVVTSAPTDATSVTISGGGLPAALPFSRQGSTGTWRAQASFPTQAQLDAFFPSASTYTLTLSGGTLGTLTQSVPLGPEGYPEVPYLTGSTWTDLALVNAEQDLALSWNDPGTLTAGAGVTRLGLRDAGGTEVFVDLTAGANAAAVLPANTLTPQSAYEGTLQFTNETSVSGAGGFGADGSALHYTTTTFSAATMVDATVTWRNGGTNPDSYDCTDAQLGQNWIVSVDLSTTGHSNATVVGYSNATSVLLGGGQTVLVSGIKYLQLPFKGGPTATWVVPLPDDVSLAGFTLRTQALHVFGVTPYALSNAQDLLIGS